MAYGWGPDHYNEAWLLQRELAACERILRIDENAERDEDGYVTIRVEGEPPPESGYIGRHRVQG
jgi:hypothetical protein